MFDQAAGVPSARIRPVLLSGGSGTRLWPLSRDESPKQFLRLLGQESLFEATLARIDDPDRFLAPIVVCGASHVGHVEETLARRGTEAVIIVEPAARNTAPAVALAAHWARGPELQLVLPCDHHVARPERFLAAVGEGVLPASDGALVTFGVQPDKPETGYGYIAAAPGEGPRKVDRFIEKPALAEAERMLAAGDHFWNAGIFLWRSDILVEQLRRHAPDVEVAARQAVDEARLAGRVVHAAAAPFARSPSISVDYALMEKTASAVVVPADMGWSDVGNWASLHELAAQDEHGNAFDSGSLAIDSRGCLVRSTGPRVVTVGVDDLMIIVTDEVALVLRRSDAQRVKEAASLYQSAQVRQSIALTD